MKKLLPVLLLAAAANAPAFAQKERMCTEEQQQATEWIQWAAENRAACLVQTTTPQARASCLEKVKLELTAMEKEHAQVYAGQIQTLNPSHPIVKNLLAKLKDNVQVAESAIMTDAEPNQLALLRKEACMSRR